MTLALHQYPELKENFQRLCQLGEGSFGKVYLAQKLPQQPSNQVETTNQNMNKANIKASQEESQGTKTARSAQDARFFAIKKLKPYIRKKNVSTNSMKIEQYPEIQVMKCLDHTNVMSIRQIIQESKGYETSHYLVLDLGVGLMELTRHKQVAPSFEQLKCIISQIVAGLDHIHSQGYMHRDVKPSNIYLMYDGTVKVGDFSISRRVSTAEPQAQQSEQGQQKEKTGNVTTRFYRAPEIIYGSRHYDQSIDIWGLGCTIAELILHQTLFPGSSDINQLQLIFSVLGCPQDHWPTAENLPYYLQFDNSKPAKGLANIIPNMPPTFMDFLSRCLTLDPAKRPTTKELLTHPLLQEVSSPARAELGKMCAYLQQKSLSNMFVKLK